MKKNHPVLRIILILFVMLSFNVIAGLAAAHARQQFPYPADKIAMISVVTIVLADLVFLYLLLIKIPKLDRSRNLGSDFESLVSRYYTGDNWDEAFRKAYAEWERLHPRG